MNSLYSEVLLDYYRNPPNRGSIANATLSASEVNTSCGDELTIYLKIEKGKVKQAKFTGKGCIVSLAAMSMLCEKIEGKPISAVAKLNRSTMLKILGIKLTPVREKCALLGLKTLKAAMEKV